MATKFHVKNTEGALEFRCSLEKQETLSAPTLPHKKESVCVFDLPDVPTSYLSWVIRELDNYSSQNITGYITKKFF